MSAHQCPGKDQFQKGAAIDAEMLFIEFKVQEQRSERDQHPVPHQVNGGYSDQVAQYACKTPYENGEVQDEQVLIKLSRCVLTG